MAVLISQFCLVLLQVDAAGNSTFKIVFGIIMALLAFFAGRYVLGFENKQKANENSIRALYEEVKKLTSALATQQNQHQKEVSDLRLELEQETGRLTNLIYENSIKIRDELGIMNSSLAVVKNELLKS